MLWICHKNERDRHFDKKPTRVVKVLSLYLFEIIQLYSRHGSISFVTDPVDRSIIMQFYMSVDSRRRNFRVNRSKKLSVALFNAGQMIHKKISTMSTDLDFTNRLRSFGLKISYRPNSLVENIMEWTIDKYRWPIRARRFDYYGAIIYSFY